MKNIVFIAASLVILCAFNWSIFEKEALRRDGETVLLELGPVDPRSLMQGDYMRLNYKAMDVMTQWAFPDVPERGYVVISVGADNIGSVARIDDGRALKENEMILRYHKEYNRFRIVTDSFLFQEGLRDVYQPAKYGVFKFDQSGNHILVGLAGTNLKTIEPPEDRIPPLSLQP
jgi:uncharacterized membrane-anchored protein